MKSYTADEVASAAGISKRRAFGLMTRVETHRFDTKKEYSTVHFDAKAREIMIAHQAALNSERAA
jgi:hypothetical protein